MQGAFPVVLHACLRVQAVSQRHELLVCDILEDFCTAAIARVGVDEQKWLDFRNSRYNTANGDKFPEMYTSNVAYTKRNIRPRGFEVQVAVESLRFVGNVDRKRPTSGELMKVGTGYFHPVRSPDSSPSADVLSRRGHHRDG
jgi:hypothetical protein